jgi:uncharacterized protein YdaU (DUF1376 family)
VASGDLPFFKFYPTDFAASGKVEAMTTEAVGAYILLLGKAWHQSPPCSLPADPHILAKWSRLGVDGWAGVEAMVLACWTKRGDGRLYNARLESEYIKATREREAKSEGGKRSAAARRKVSSKILQRVLEDTSSISEVRSQTPDSKPPPQRAGANAATVIARIQAMIGRDLSSSDRLTITRAEDRYGQMGTVEIHGQQVGYIDLFDRAVGVAIAEPGFEWRSAGSFTKYIAAIVQRAVDERVWPGERPEPVRMGPSTPAIPPMSQAEREAVERAWAKQQAREAKR